jgi:hypothetical protein
MASSTRPGRTWRDTIWAFARAPTRDLLFVDLSTVAELQVVLEGVALPAERSELLSYAAQERATPAQIGLLRRLPEHKFETIDEVAEALLPVQPPRHREVPHRPREESGAPPGGDAYTQRRPESGAVRD